MAQIVSNMRIARWLERGGSNIRIAMGAQGRRESGKAEAGSSASKQHRARHILTPLPHLPHPPPLSPRHPLWGPKDPTVQNKSRGSAHVCKFEFLRSWKCAKAHSFLFSNQVLNVRDVYSILLISRSVTLIVPRVFHTE